MSLEQMSDEYHQCCYILSMHLVCAWASSNVLMDEIKKYEILLQQEEKYFYYKDRQRPKQVFPEMWILLFWRYSKIDWTNTRQFILGPYTSGGRHGDLKRSLPSLKNSVILWISVVLLREI